MLKALVPSAPGKGQRCGRSTGPCAWPHTLHRERTHPLAERTPWPGPSGLLGALGHPPASQGRVSVCGLRVSRLSACFLFAVSPSCCFSFSPFSPGNSLLPPPHLLSLPFPPAWAEETFLWRLATCLCHVAHRSSSPSVEPILPPELMVPASGSEAWREGLGRAGACLLLAVVHGTAMHVLPCSRPPRCGVTAGRAWRRPLIRFLR